MRYFGNVQGPFTKEKGNKDCSDPLVNQICEEEFL